MDTNKTKKMHIGRCIKAQLEAQGHTPYGWPASLAAIAATSTNFTTSTPSTREPCYEYAE